MENKIPVEIKEKWVTALRSGEYKQTTGNLKDEVGYCCLGVLGSLCGYSDEKLRENEFLYRSIFPLVPPNLQDIDRIPTQLANLNDDGISFSEIADYIEKNL